ncbi:MAG: hypothetical protein HQL85_14560 [Magnetococcales bacterium]|nr:hypothetical protein [Magnetococcales bacterium]
MRSWEVALGPWRKPYGKYATVPLPTVGTPVLYSTGIPVPEFPEFGPHSNKENGYGVLEFPNFENSIGGWDVKAGERQEQTDRRYHPLLLWGVVFILIITFCSIAMEAMVRLIAPQNLSGTWLERKGGGLLVNRADDSVRHQFGPRVVTYNLGSFGLRDAVLDSIGKKVLVVGDSFTFGWLLEDKHTYVHHLQEMADSKYGSGKIRFLNGGIGGSGTDSQLRFIEMFGDDIKPDAVVVYLNMDDIGRSIRNKIYAFDGMNETSLTVLPVTISTYEKLKGMLNDLPFYSQTLQWILERSHLVQLIRNILSRFNRNTVDWNLERTIPDPKLSSSETASSANVLRADSVQLGKALFLRLKNWTDQRGIALLVLTTGFFNPNGIKDDPTYYFTNQCHEFFRQENIAFGDLYPHVLGTMAAGGLEVMAEREKSLIIHNEVHPNEEGAKAVSRASWPYIKRLLAVLVPADG